MSGYVEFLGLLFNNFKVTVIMSRSREAYVVGENTLGSTRVPVSISDMAVPRGEYSCINFFYLSVIIVSAINASSQFVWKQFPSPVNQSDYIRY